MPYMAKVRGKVGERSRAIMALLFNLTNGRHSYLTNSSCVHKHATACLTLTYEIQRNRPTSTFSALISSFVWRENDCLELFVSAELPVCLGT